jgi:sulfate transport system permease protein
MQPDTKDSLAGRLGEELRKRSAREHPKTSRARDADTSAERTAKTRARPSGPARRARADPAWVRYGLITLTLLVVGVLVVIPILNVFAGALSEGLGTYVRNLLDDPDTRSAILLTLTVVPIALVANVIFGLAAAWTVTRFTFPGRTLLVALIDLPFSVSPVVAGLMFVLIFGLQGYLGPFLRRDGYAVMAWLVAGVVVLALAVVYAVFRPRAARARRGLWKLSPWLVALAGAALFAVLVGLQRLLGLWPEHRSLKIIFATPGLVLATSFVTFPFVARELIPVMDAVGSEEELAALSLGASGWQMFWDVTVPNVKWGLAYGIILCNARAMGEFGAVYVVSGHVAGQTDTMPLRIEKLFQEYNLPGSFAVASLLTLVALLTLFAKSKLEQHLPDVPRGQLGRKAP